MIYKIIRQKKSPQRGEIHNLQDKVSQDSQRLWNKKLLLNHDNTSYLHSSSMGSGGTVAQEMIDMVDNLIDASPQSRADMYEKQQFSIKVMTA